MWNKKPRIKKIGHNNWRVYYDGWRVFDFFSIRECIGLIHLDKILKSKGFDIQRLVDSHYIDIDKLYCIPLWTKEFTEMEPETFLLLKKLERLRRDGFIK